MPFSLVYTWEELPFHRTRSYAGRLNRVGRGSQLALHAVEHVAKLAEFCFHRGESGSHLGGALLHSNRLKSHSQAAEDRSQGRRSSGLRFDAAAGVLQPTLADGLLLYFWQIGYEAAASKTGEEPAISD